MLSQDSRNEKLLQAAEDGDLNTIRDLFASEPYPDVDYLGPYDTTPLMKACEHGHLDVVQLLVDMGADLMTPKDHRGCLPIHDACMIRDKSKRAPLIRIFLKKDPKMIDAKTSDGASNCLQIAVFENDGELVRSLLNEKADPWIRDSDGKTAWDYANNDPEANRVEAFTAFLLKKEAEKLAESDDSDMEPGVLELGRCGTTLIYWNYRAARRDIFLFLRSLAAKDDSIAQISPRINRELCPFRKTESGVAYRKPSCVLESIRYQRSTIFQPEHEVFDNESLSTGTNKVHASSTGDYGVRTKITSEAQSFPTVLNSISVEVRDQRICSQLDSNTMDLHQRPLESSAIPKDIKTLIADYISIVVPYFQMAVMFSSEFDNRPPGAFEALTLDEHCYPTLPQQALERRNKDQTLSRFHSPDGDRRCTPLIKIGQAWIWKFQDMLLIADLDQKSFGYDPDFKTGFQNTLENLVADKIPDIFLYIAKTFAALIDRIETEKVNDYPLLDTYGTSIVKVAEDVEEYVNKPGVENIGIMKEKDFLHQISDIREELTMIQRVLTQQEEIWGQFASEIWPGIWAKSQEGQKPFYIDASDDASREEERLLMRAVLRPNLLIQKSRRRVEQLDEDAERVERSVITQLDLKAKHTSLREAHATAVMSAAVFGFTVVTIIFTPLSFMMSLFALPIRGFQQNQIQSVWTDQAGMYTPGYVGKWTVTAEIISVGLTLIASWLALEFGLRYRIASRTFCFLIRKVMVLIGRFEVTERIWHRFVLLCKKNVKFSGSFYQDRYPGRILKELQDIDPSEKGARHRLREICELNEDELPKAWMNGSNESEAGGHQETTRHHRFRRWRNTVGDEEHGE